MKFRRVIVGPLETNCYIIGEKEAVIIDPGADAGKIRDVVNLSGVNIQKILLTHGHFDHVGAVKELRERLKVPVFMHKNDVFMLKSGGAAFRREWIAPEFECDGYFEDGDKIAFGDEAFYVLHTPGHTDGSVCFISGNNVFCGDLLFYESIGRCDSLETEVGSIMRLIDNAPKANVYPGHGEYTTIEHEIKYNPYLAW